MNSLSMALRSFNRIMILYGTYIRAARKRRLSLVWNIIFTLVTLCLHKSCYVFCQDMIRDFDGLPTKWLSGNTEG